MEVEPDNFDCDLGLLTQAFFSEITIDTLVKNQTLSSSETQKTLDI